MIFIAVCLNINILIVYTIHLLDESQSKWDNMLLEDNKLDKLYKERRNYVP